MTDILVDSNVILDILTEDPQWFEWSAQKLTGYANQGELIINPISMLKSPSALTNPKN
jgi:hypothetical protein